jgi:hypothetical protein
MFVVTDHIIQRGSINIPVCMRFCLDSHVGDDSNLLGCLDLYIVTEISEVCSALTL